MQAHVASLINSILLITLGSWGYFGSDDPSVTALIPVVFGVLLAALIPGVKKQSKIQSHIAVFFTVLIFFGLTKPLTGALDRGDTLAVARVATMLGSTAFAMIFFVKSFIDARKARQAESAE